MFNRILRRIKDFGNRILESRLFVLILVFCILSAILISRLFYLQIVKGDYYLENYKMQIRKTREDPRNPRQYLRPERKSSRIQRACLFRHV